MRNNWIDEQLKFMVSQWDNAISTHYPQHRKAWEDPEEHFRHIQEEWGLLDATQVIPWDEYLKGENLTLLELGCGTGWLSAYLSKFSSISNIYAVDSSLFFIEKMMPEIIRLMDGEAQKIIPINGLFTPILVDNNSIDIVVACSAIHHANELVSVLEEIYRVLKPEGKLFILNETPLGYFSYLYLLIKIAIKILINSSKKQYSTLSQAVSSNGILYDPTLGDRAYPTWLWEKAIRKAGFSLEIVKTKHKTLKKSAKGICLTHFICKK